MRLVCKDWNELVKKRLARSLKQINFRYELSQTFVGKQKNLIIWNCSDGCIYQRSGYYNSPSFKCFVIFFRNMKGFITIYPHLTHFRFSLLVEANLENFRINQIVNVLKHCQIDKYENRLNFICDLLKT